MSRAGLAAWANQTLDERVLDLLSDIMFAAEEIDEMVRIEAAAPLTADFHASIECIYDTAAITMGHLALRRRGH